VGEDGKAARCNVVFLMSAQRKRKKVEALFAELKNLIGLRRLRLRRLKFVREQFFLAAAAQNLKRLVRFLGTPPEGRASNVGPSGNWVVSDDL
jgi:hypothetical protein